MLPEYEIYAIKYGEHQRNASANFIGGEAHDGPMPMDYFVWLIRQEGRCWMVDTGFNEAAARDRNRVHLRSPAAALGLLGADATQVQDVILTHMHYDHAGNFDQFPAAIFHLQDREMQYATGRYMAHRCFHEAYSVFDTLRLVENVYRGRVRFHDGNAELAPGLSVHLLGGHTMGLQVVRVHTARGWVVLASDASHYYRNIEEKRPFPIVFNLGEMVEGWGRLEGLASSPEHVIPGHDPEVLKRYAPPTLALAGIACSLHTPPIFASN